MVSISTFAAMIFTLTAAFFLPAIVLVVLCAARRVPWKSALAGLFTYLVIQYLLRLPLLSLLYRVDTVANFMDTLVGSGLVMGLSAAIFEAGSRWLIGSKLLGRKRDLTARDALGYGLGHGLADAIVVVGVSAASNLMLAFSIHNNNFLDYITKQSLSQEQAMRIYSVITGTPAIKFAASGIERMMVMVLQIAFTFLVFYGIRQKKSRYFWLAFGGHFLLNFGISLMTPHGIWMGEGFIFLLTMLTVVGCMPLVSHFRQMDRVELPAEGMPQEESPEGLLEGETAEGSLLEEGAETAESEEPVLTAEPEEAAETEEPEEVEEPNRDLPQTEEEEEKENPDR